MVLKDRFNKLDVEQLKFTRSKFDWNITSEMVTKNYGFVYDKRVAIGNDTIPYGYTNNH